MNPGSGGGRDGPNGEFGIGPGQSGRDTDRGPPPGDDGRCRILVVDDEPGAADLAAVHVDRLVDGVETVARTDPEAALGVVRDECVDCVVSDYNMPELDGLELLEAVRSIDSDLPFVLFTGRGSEGIASEAISAGVTDYLQKGVGRDRYEVLANSVANALDRRRAERDLREVNAKVTAIHGFASDLTSVHDTTEVFERVVDAVEEILDFDRCVTARLEGDRLRPAARSERADPDEIAAFEPAERVRTGDADRGVETPADVEGVETWVDVEERSVIRVPIGSEGVFYAVAADCDAFDARDVEFAELVAAHAADAIEQIETEDELRGERDRLSALFDDLPLPAARTVSRPGAGRRLEATNDAFEATFGYAASDRGYQAICDAIVPDDADGVDLAGVADGGTASRVEVRRHTTEGVRDFILHVIPVERPRETVVYTVYADIGEQKRVERILRRLHETTRTMLRGDDCEAIAEIATRAAIDILEFPSSGVRLYDDDRDALLPTALSAEARASLGDRPAFGPGDGIIWEAFERGEPIAVDDLDATETVIEYGDLRSILVVPLGDHGVMPLGSDEAGFFDDTAVQLARVLGANVTVALDRADRTRQLRERDDDLKREVERLEKFAGLVSHDLRNPLNVATGRVELACERVDDADALANLDKATDAHDRMEELIDDLLALARQGRTVDDPEPVSLAAAAERAWRTVDTTRATLDVRDGDAAIEADPERLRTLFENLFTNSVEHGLDHGDASATPARADSTGTDCLSVTVGSLPDGFYVADDGTGFDIDPEAAVEYGTSDNPGGTGFGLAIVREIAAAHGWEFAIDEAASGARFEFVSSG
ncbi:GAF domain-containing protein [Halorubrum sp. BV1]|uniref:GAF domain-containing protein n=1 Tax=Halorubrum sp. BV1 TaxID=1498500 RepID=UPI0009B5B47E|nr:GAF domain-containing protein [Halorubrum sp. BV1]